jgi:ribosomal protein S18 acetylase RimI-like enzyme
LSKRINHPWIKLKDSLNHEDYQLIHGLETLCVLEDQITFKLELDYKLAGKENSTDKACLRDINEFMYFDGEQLIGYMGIGSFGGGTTPLEITGMVHPQNRRLGIFTRLNELVMAECRRRNRGTILALCDKVSISGEKFLEKAGAVYQYSEFEMYLHDESYGATKKQLLPEVTFRKATNADAFEIARQNTIYFGDDPVEENEDDGSLNTSLPEEEEKRGMVMYLVEQDNRVIGKVNLELNDGGTGAIYGLGVLPEYRSLGLGRATLLNSVEKLKDAKATKVKLQVAAENSTALKLYKSCGFQEMSVMDYFELK